MKKTSHIDHVLELEVTKKIKSDEEKLKRSIRQLTKTANEPSFEDESSEKIVGLNKYERKVKALHNPAVNC
jgi:hypothetical protein